MTFYKETVLYKKETKYDNMEKFSFQGTTLNGGRFFSRGRGRHPERRIDSDELIYVVSGELAIYEERNDFQLRSGEWVILRRGRLHGGLKEYPPDLSFFWLHFVGDDDFLDRLPQHGRAVRPERLADYCQNFIAEQQEKESDAESLFLLFSLIMRELQRSEDVTLQQGSLSPLALAAQKIIRLRYVEMLTTELLAAELHCNTEYLGRVYRLNFGETISETINRSRVEYAAKLLSSTDLSIKEILQQCGFNDPAYFRRRFVRHYAMTPGKFRLLCTAGKVNSQ